MPAFPDWEHRKLLSKLGLVHYLLICDLNIPIPTSRHNGTSVLECAQ